MMDTKAIETCIKYCTDIRQYPGMEAQRELASLKSQLEQAQSRLAGPLRCPNCDCTLATQDGYWYCPNDACGLAPEGGSEASEEG
jgi:hypothetical protein